MRQRLAVRGPRARGRQKDSRANAAKPQGAEVVTTPAGIGPGGPDLCEGCEGSGFRGPFGDERCYCTAPDLRDIVRARMIELNGGRKKGAQRALAKRLAPLWGLDDWKAAERKLILWFRRGENRTDMTTEPFSVLLDVLGLLDVLRLALRPKEG